jgi:hypothetical protein
LAAGGRLRWEESPVPELTPSPLARGFWARLPYATPVPAFPRAVPGSPGPRRATADVRMLVLPRRFLTIEDVVE